MTSPDPVLWNIDFSPAEARVDLDVDVVFDAARQVLPVDHVQRTAVFDVERYVVDEGIPRDLPRVGELVSVQTGLGVAAYTEVPPDPRGVLVGSDVRWLPTESSFTESDSWRPYTGDPELVWQCGPSASPYLDEDYSYVRGGREIRSSAMVFDGSTWMQLSSAGFTADAFSIGVVGVLRPGSGAYYSVVESSREREGETGLTNDENPLEDVDTVTDFGLRYSHGSIGVWAGSTLLNYDSLARQGVPVVMVLSLDTRGGRLAVYDGARSTRTFSMLDVGAFDVNLFLGRGGVAFDEDSTAVMDLLEVDMWGRGLDLSAMESYVNLMASCHGILP